MIFFVGRLSDKTTMNRNKITDLIRKTEEVHAELLLLQKQWQILTEASLYHKEIERYKQEIKELHHMLEEQECEARHMRLEIKKLSNHSHA